MSPPGEIHKGDLITFAFVVRNVGKEDRTVKYIRSVGWGCSADKPGRLTVDWVYSGGWPITSAKVLRPRETWEVTQVSLLTRRPTRSEGTSHWLALRPGKYLLSCPAVLVQEIPPPKEGRLPTGHLELDILPPGKGPRGKAKEDQGAKKETRAPDTDPAGRTK